jgi:putative ABC transport system ATP-binding protein
VSERDTEYILRAVDLQKSFGLTPALQGSSLEVKQGETIAIMGPSGSGKSTLLHCVACIFTPDKGEVWFDGKRLDQMNEEERTELRRTQFGFVFQFGQLVPELTAEDNVALPLMLDYKVSSKEAYKRARSWFSKLSIEGMEKHRSGELSGGQAQRVAIARALVIQPKVIFADEPTGSLDSLAGENVMKLMMKAACDQGTTVVIVTHDARIAAYAGRQVMVRDGKVMDVAHETRVVR